MRSDAATTLPAAARKPDRRLDPKGLAAALAAMLRAHAPFILLVLAYVAAAFAVGAAFGQPVAPFLYVVLMGSAVVAAGILFFLVHAVYVMAVLRPERPLKTIADALATRYLTRERIVNALPIVLLLPVVISVFTSLKTMIPAIHPFAWDATFAAWDEGLHIVPPWRILQPLLGHPLITGPINLAYGLWFVLMVGIWLWQAMSLRAPRLRMQYFLSFVLCWALLGNVAATWLSSAGPCYFAAVTGLPDPYAPLMAYLRAADQSFPILSLAIQDQLWSVYSAGDLAIGSGISAMPSMHVSCAVLFALLGWRSGRALGIALTAFAAVVVVGAVHLGWHYAIDGYAALVGTLAIWWAVGKWCGRDEDDAVRERMSNV
jgi:hypothetical protein